MPCDTFQPMSLRIAVLGAGAVGGYFGARLSRAGSDVVFIARKGHLRAIRERGLLVRSPLGDLLVQARGEEETAKVGPVDLVLFAVKSYDVDGALASLHPLMGPETIVLTLQNGVDSPHQVAAAIGERPVLGGAAYIAASLSAPGLIEQTGTVRRIAFGEVFGPVRALSPRVERLREALAGADIQAEAEADGWGPLWKKYIFLAPIAALTGAARLPIGPLRDVPTFPDAFRAVAAEVEHVARAEGADPGPGAVEAALDYIGTMAPSVRSSLLIDLQQGKRIEVESLLGALVRRGRAAGVPTPVSIALYTVLKPYEYGPRPEAASS